MRTPSEIENTAQSDVTETQSNLTEADAVLEQLLADEECLPLPLGPSYTPEEIDTLEFLPLPTTSSSNATALQSVQTILPPIANDPLILQDPEFSDSGNILDTELLLKQKDKLIIDLSINYDEKKLNMLGKFLEQYQNITSLTIIKNKKEKIEASSLKKLKVILSNSGIFNKSILTNSTTVDFSILTLNYTLSVERKGTELNAIITHIKQIVVSMGNNDEQLKSKIAHLEKTLMEDQQESLVLGSDTLQENEVHKHSRGKKKPTPINSIKFKSALENKNPIALLACLETNPALINTTLSDGSNSLQVAIASGSSETVNLVLAYRPTVSFSHLEQAFELESLESIQIFDQIYTVLLEKGIIKGIDHPIPTKTRGASFLQLAAAKNLDDFVVYLLNKGANPNLADWDSKTAFFFALENGNLDMMNLLTKAKKIRDDQQVDNHISHILVMQYNDTALRNVLNKVQHPSSNHRAALRLFLGAQSENFLKSNCYVAPKNEENKTLLDLISTEDGQPLKTKLNFSTPILNAINVWSDRDLAIKEELETYLTSLDFMSHAQIPPTLVEIISSFITIRGEYSARPRTSKFWSNVEQFRSPSEPETLTTLFRLHNKAKRESENSNNFKKTQLDSIIPKEILTKLVSIVTKEINLVGAGNNAKIYAIIAEALQNLFSMLYKDANLFKTENIRKLIDLSMLFNAELPFHAGDLPSKFQIPSDRELLEKIVCPIIVNSINDGDLIKVCKILQSATQINLPLLADLETDDPTLQTILNNEQKQKLRQYVLTHGEYLKKVEEIAAEANIKTGKAKLSNLT